MQYSKNYKMNLPELADQFNLKHQNENTEKIDTQMKANADAIGAEERRATQKENTLSSAISTETNRAKEKENSLSSSISAETTRATQKENAINSDLTSEKSTTKSHRENKNNPHGVTKAQVGLGNVDDKSFKTMAQALFDMEHPIGKKGRIIQYAWEDEPNTKYNNALISSTWKPVTEYDGKFFKIDSTKAIGTTTAESLPNIKGHLKKQLNSGIGVLPYASLEGGNNAFSLINKNSDGAAGAYHNASYEEVKFDANKCNTVYQDGAKVQPDNISIKVWERTK